MADNLDESLATLESHFSSQMFKAVATLKASNAMKHASKAEGKCCTADENESLWPWGVRCGVFCKETSKRGARWVLRNVYVGVFSLGYTSNRNALSPRKKAWSWEISHRLRKI